MSDRGYRDLIAWQKAMALVKDTYHLTSVWPSDERFGLTLQARRAAVSVPSNIAEGSGRTGVRHLRNHLSIAHGSLCELETQLILAHDLGFVESDEIAALLERSWGSRAGHPRSAEEPTPRLTGSILAD